MLAMKISTSMVRWVSNSPVAKVKYLEILKNLLHVLSPIYV